MRYDRNYTFESSKLKPAWQALFAVIAVIIVVLIDMLHGGRRHHRRWR